MRKTGIFEFWNQKRGFGFIAISRSERYFVHIMEIKKGPLGDPTGLNCSFEVKPSDDPNKLPLAIDVWIECGAL